LGITSPPVSPPTFYAAGINYRQHTLNAQARGRRVQVPKQADIGYRAVNAPTGPDTPIVVPADSSGKLQFAGELVVVIGRLARRVRQEDALSHVFGYTIANDVSKRSWQKCDRTFWRAKNIDTFKPTGPWIETDVDLDTMVTTVQLNGAEVSRFTTNDMIFGIAEYISVITRNIIAVSRRRDQDGDGRSDAGHGRGGHRRGDDQRHRHVGQHRGRRAITHDRRPCGGGRKAASSGSILGKLLASARYRVGLEHTVFLHQVVDDKQRVGR
jgi:fumarylacetoacetase-like protein